MAIKKTITPISIIIPTLNEADFLGYLLFSLSRQTYKNFEVIISDANSGDQTIKIAKTFETVLPKVCYCSSKKRSPGIQRNNGAKKAQYDLLLFLDADTILPPNFLEQSLKEIKRKKFDIANPVSFPLTKKVIDQYLYLITNKGIDLLQEVFPLAYGWAIFSTLSLHKKINGFDEKLEKMAEDTDYVMRAQKTGAKFGILKNSSPHVSVRRLDHEGRGGALKNMIIQAFYFTIFGKYNAQKLIKRSYGDFGSLKKLINEQRKKSKFLKRLPKEQVEKFIKNLSQNLRQVLKEVVS